MSRRRNGTARGRFSIGRGTGLSVDRSGLPTVCDTDAGEACEGEEGSELHVEYLGAVWGVSEGWTALGRGGWPTLNMC